MREIQANPIFTAAWQPFFILLTLSLSVLSGCGVKTRIATPVTPGILQSKSAGFEELLGILRRYDDIHSLACNHIRVTLTSGRRERGWVEQYRSVPGYILLRRPDSVRLVIQNPVTQTTLLDVLSVGKDLSVWYPRENKFFVGSNSARELVAEDSPDSKGFLIPIRGTHLFEAIFPQSIRTDAPGVRISLEPAADSQRRYYVLGVYGDAAPPRIDVIRKIWIERSGLTIARQELYGEGEIASDVTYSNETPFGGFNLPLRVHIDRPLDGYSLDMQFEGWRIDPDLGPEAFSLNPPPGARIVHLRERGRSGVS